MQKDFTKYGQHFFQFKILFFENNLQKRLLLEKQFLKQQLEIGLYNGTTCSQFQKNRPVLGQQILIGGRIYSSIRKAAKAVGVSRTSISRRLANNKDFKYIRLDKIPISRGKYNFYIDGVCYLSTQEVIINNLAISDNQVRERCDSKIKKNGTIGKKYKKIGLTTIPRGSRV